MIIYVSLIHYMYSFDNMSPLLKNCIIRSVVDKLCFHLNPRCKISWILLTALYHLVQLTKILLIKLSNIVIAILTFSPLLPIYIFIALQTLLIAIGQLIFLVQRFKTSSFSMATH